MEINLAARDLRAFLAVAHSQSFSKAAQQLHLSQSALSSQVARLEDMLGARLFDRSTRAVKLNAAGEVFLTHASQLLDGIAKASEAVKDVALLRTGCVSIAALPSLSARLLPHLFGQFSERFPGVRLRLVDTLSEQAFELVRHGQVDFALTAANPVYEDLTYTPLMTDTFVLLANVEHPAALNSVPVCFCDVLNWPHISMTRPSSVRQYMDAESIRQGVRFQPAFEVDHLVTVRGMLLAGLGVAALPALAADVISSGLAQRPIIAPVIQRSIGLVTQRDGALSDAAQAMIQMLHIEAGHGG